MIEPWDLFAAAALQGQLANAVSNSAIIAGTPNAKEWRDTTVGAAAEFADEMMKEREKMKGSVTTNQ